MSVERAGGVEACSPEVPNKSQQSSAGTAPSWYFVFFFFSGFCCILYELIWFRLAMADFGVTTAMISIVLSNFMAGLGIGSWASGLLLRHYARTFTARPLCLYALTEMLIGWSAVVVPLEMHEGRILLEHVGSSLSLSSSGYYIAAGAWLAVTLIPWCACMGATIPVGMFAIRCQNWHESQDGLVQRSFSFLYIANVLGAVTGTLVPLLLIELYGFRRTGRFGMLLNFAICAAALALAGTKARAGASSLSEGCPPPANQTRSAAPGPVMPLIPKNSTLWLLFATGLTSMGMEVVWVRLYTVYVGPLVYSFAMILGVYLFSTFLGSTAYRLWYRRHARQGSFLWLAVWFAALTSLVAADPRVSLVAWMRVPVGIAAFSALLGFLTPGLVDRFSQGDPDRAGLAYGINIAGCILGPLVAGFLLLPFMDERYALVALAFPWLLVGLPLVPLRRLSFRHGAAIVAVMGMTFLPSFALIFRTRDYVQCVTGAQVRRDSTATVIATGTGMDKALVVNGVSMTSLSAVTKMMAALPLASLDHTPRNALVICFGMGSTHRSVLAWGIDSTAVDLVPSVPALFWYFHADAQTLLQSPRSHIVIDDGRRFLERTTSRYDVIIIDPPPPIAAAGSSLLYSREFYSAATKRLRPDGILMQWYPPGDAATTSAVSRALKESFPYLRAFDSMGRFGIHYMASNRPLPDRSAAELARRMPERAAADLVEWGPFPTAERQFAAVLQSEESIDRLIDLARDAPALQDDRPINEYNLLRTDFWGR